MERHETKQLANDPAIAQKKIRRVHSFYWYLVIILLFSVFNLRPVNFSFQFETFVDSCRAQKKATKLRQLQFVHIPKTGGTAMGSIAKNANLTWSVCHFNPPKVTARNNRCYYNSTEASNLQFNFMWENKSIPWWHVPPAHVHAFYPGIDPYADADLFAVVRNPYTRMISEYRYRMDLNRKYVNKSLGVEHFNQWIQQRLVEFKANMMSGNLSKGIPGNQAYYGDGNEGHLIPQYDFVYNKDSRCKVIEHVLFYENLHSDFSNLMAKYDLPLELPQTHVMPNRKFIDRKLGVSNLTIENMLLIEAVYIDDFREFGYEMIAYKGRDE